VCTTTTVAAEAVADSAREGQPRTVADRHVRECVEREEEIEGLPYLLKVAWPAYRADYRPTRRARLTVADETVSFGTTADLSRGVIADFESERALIVARTIARGTAKLALTKGAERSIEDKSEVAGMARRPARQHRQPVLLERADTRSWHLLPGRHRPWRASDCRPASMS
jgi:hypothetical protein